MICEFNGDISSFNELNGYIDSFNNMGLITPIRKKNETK